MKNSDINIRDPFVLVHDGKYYLYGTRGSTCWGPATGFDVYVGTDLENWSDPIACFENDGSFWADRNYWAPEVHEYLGSFYMFASFKKEGVCRGTAILKASSPEGPFVPWSEGPVTPSEWDCLDGTLYVDDGVPYIVFCHEWCQCGDGEIHRMKLTQDLKAPAAGPELMFRASSFKEVKNLRGADNPGYVTDGPFMFKNSDGRLFCIWSSFTEDEGYCELVALSDNGHVTGSFRQLSPLFRKDGGHGMLFRDLNGKLLLTLHRPNSTPYERPVFIPVDSFPDD